MKVRAIKAVTVVATKHARRFARIEHVLVGIGAVGLASGLHVLEVVAAFGLIGVEGLLMFVAAGETAEA